MARDRAERMKHIKRQAQEAVEREWGRGFHGLGPRLRQAVMAEAVLRVAAMQDEDEVSDRTVREIVVDGYDLVVVEGERNP